MRSNYTVQEIVNDQMVSKCAILSFQACTHNFLTDISTIKVSRVNFSPPMQGFWERLEICIRLPPPPSMVLSIYDWEVCFLKD